MGVLPPMVAAFTEAEIEAGMDPDVEDNKVNMPDTILVPSTRSRRSSAKIIH